MASTGVACKQADSERIYIYVYIYIEIYIQLFIYINICLLHRVLEFIAVSEPFHNVYICSL